MLTREQQQELERRLQDVVCRFCVERGPEGDCSLTAVKQCPITVHLPRLVEVASKVESDSMTDYVDQVRKDVCGVCEFCESPEDCPPRAEGHCALDAYLLPVFEIIDAYFKEKNLRSA